MWRKSQADKFTISHQFTSEAQQTPCVDVFKEKGYRFWIFLSKSGVAGDHLLNALWFFKKYLYELGSKKIQHSALFLFMNAQYFSYDWCIEKFFTISTTPCTQKYPQEQPAEYVNIDDHVKLVGDADELLQDGGRLWRMVWFWYVGGTRLVKPSVTWT